MIRAQQESIKSLKQLLEGKMKKLKAKTPSKKSKGKQKEGKIPSSAHTEEEEYSISESSKPPSKEGDNSEDGSSHSKRISKLEQRLEALTSPKGLQEVGVIWLYMTEWDLIPYPPKFKALNLLAFDGKGSQNKHVYYFKSQTGNIISNDAILAHLFIGTLKGLAFEWFMKLPEGSIKNWGDLKKLFLSRFFEDDSKITKPTLLATRQRKRQSIKAFCRGFRIWHSDILAV